jgi:hypothetical protein
MPATPQQILKEALLLWITLTTRLDAAVNPSAAGQTSDLILDSIAADFNAAKGGGNWNWDNIQRPLAKVITDAIIASSAAHLAIATEFQSDSTLTATDAAGNPIQSLADTGGWDPTLPDHPRVAELIGALGL